MNLLPAMKYGSSALLILFASLFLFASIANAEDELPVPVKAALVSDVDAVVPGGTFKLGVLFEIIPHWHIYWKNSGDTGLPTKVSFILPPGFEAGEIKWPVPNVYTRAGDITDYGYEDSLLLFAEIKAPENLKTGSEARIKAKVSWVSCEEICIPGRAELSLKLPVSQKEASVNKDLFATWEGTLPLDSSDKNNPFNVDISHKDMDDNTKMIKIKLGHDKSTRVTEVYPVPGDSLSVSNIEINDKTGEDGTDIELRTRALAGSGSLDEELELLVVYINENKKRSGVEIPIPASD